MEGLKLRLIDTLSGELLPWVEELDLRALKAKERAEIEAEARQVAEHTAELEAVARRAAEERACDLEAELARLRRELEGRKAD